MCVPIQNPHSLVFPFAFMQTIKAKDQSFTLIYLVSRASVLKLILIFLPGSTCKMACPRNSGFLRKSSQKPIGFIWKVTWTRSFKAWCRITYASDRKSKDISNTLPLKYYIFSIFFQTVFNTLALLLKKHSFLPPPQLNSTTAQNPARSTASLSSAILPETFLPPLLHILPWRGQAIMAFLAPGDTATIWEICTSVAHKKTIMWAFQNFTQIIVSLSKSVSEMI